VIRFFSLFSAVHFIAAFYETRKRFVNFIGIEKKIYCGEWTSSAHYISAYRESVRYLSANRRPFTVLAAHFAAQTM
jgi:hypothetical protein